MARRLVMAALVVSFGFCDGALARQARGEALRRTVEQAMQQSRWKDAIEAGLTLHPLDARGGSTAFNLAVAYAQSGDGSSSARWLLKAGEDGFAGATIATTAPELEPARADPVYEQAITAIRANRAKQLEAFKAHAETIPLRVILPPKHDPKIAAPLIIALHGTGGRGEEMEAAWRRTAADAGAILVCPDALRKAGDGFQWMFVDESEWLVLRTVERVKEQHAIDEARVVLTGFSQGANVALQVSTKHPSAFDGVIVCCGHWEPHAQPIPPGGGVLPRYALMTGERDEGADSNRAFAERMREVGAAVDLRIYKGVGHSLPPQREKEFTSALAFAMKPASER